MSEAFRSAPRIELDQPAYLVFADASATQALALLVDLSLTGARLKLLQGQALRSGQSLEFYWSPLCGLKPFALRARVMWISADHCGLRFETLAPRPEHVIRRLVAYHRDEAANSK